MTSALTVLGSLTEAARRTGRDTLFEHEGYAFLEAAGIRCPRRIFVRSSLEIPHANLDAIPGERLVVKIVSPAVLHKSDVGGVAIVAKRPAVVADALREMAARLRDVAIAGFLLCEFVPYEAGPGVELLVGLRWTDEFGPVLTVAPGGIHAEFLASHFRTGTDMAILSTSADEEARARALADVAVIRLALEGLRGQTPRLSVDQLDTALRPLLALGSGAMPRPLAECEINPLVLMPEGPIALDVIVRLGDRPPETALSRPVWKIKHLLEPSTIAIVGVSNQLNPGHVILNNTLRKGFDRRGVFVVKPGVAEIEGCRCVPDIASLPSRVDLLVLAVSAVQVPHLVTEIIAHEKAQSVIVIPGGLEEKAGTEGLVVEMHAALERSRRAPWQGPLINGGNCLGVKSWPGQYDTMFIPDYKLQPGTGPASPVALISQSGAFAVARASKLAAIRPKYIISTGNQMDLTVGEYLAYLADDEEIRVFAVYVEGFRPLDGLRLVKAAAEITESGRAVILYRAGRTSAGARASASHTASMAGDYAVTRNLARQAGIVVAESIPDFEDLVSLFTFLGHAPLAARRLAAVSNAGFECVAMADNLGGLELATFGRATIRALGDLLRRSKLDAVVDVHNPLDLTPMTGDAAFEEAVRIVLEDAAVDLAAIGCVPLTGALSTLPAGSGHHEDVAREESVARRLIRIRESTAKPWVAVVDSGVLYDEMARMLERAGIPTFRSADRALRLLDRFAAIRLGRAGVTGPAALTAV